MSTKKNDILAKLKELFELTKKEKFADVKLQDGSILRIDGDLVVGGKVSLISTDGAITPAPEGDLTLEDGSTITVKSGVIDVITPAAPAVDALPAVDAATNTAGLAPAVDETKKKPISPLAAADAPVVTPETPAVEGTEASNMDMIAQVCADLSARVGALEAALGTAKAENTQMKSDLAKFNAAPAATPITFKGKNLMDVIKEENASKASNKRGLNFAEQFAKDKNKIPGKVEIKTSYPKSNYDFGAEEGFGRIKPATVAGSTLGFGSGKMEITNE